MIANVKDIPELDNTTPSSGDAVADTSLTQLEKSWQLRIHDRLLNIMDLSLIGTIEEHRAREQIQETGRMLLEEESAPLNLDQRRRILKHIEDDVMGLGPLEPLLADDKVADILVVLRCVLRARRWPWRRARECRGGRRSKRGFGPLSTC